MARPQTRNGRLSRAARRRGERRRPWWQHPGTIVGSLVVLGVIGFLIQSRRTDRATGTVQQPAHPLGPGGSEAMGPASAPLLVEEYGDYECERCAEFHKTIAPQIRKLAEEGKVRFAYYPVLTRAGSLALTNAALCAGDQGAFWRYHDHLFANQGAANSSDQLIQFGRQLGIDSPRFGECVNNGRYNGWADRISARAAARGVRLMPTVFVNGREVSDPFGAPRAIQDALKPADSPGPKIPLRPQP